MDKGNTCKAFISIDYKIEFIKKHHVKLAKHLTQYQNQLLKVKVRIKNKNSFNFLAIRKRDTLVRKREIRKIKSIVTCRNIKKT